MNNRTKMTIGALALLVVVGTGFAYSKPASTPKDDPVKTRDPQGPIDLPDVDRIKSIRVAICTAWRGGVAPEAMLEHVLSQVWPDLPWGEILAVEADDDASVIVAVKTTWAEIESFRLQSKDSDRTSWCETGGPVPKSTFEERQTVLDQLLTELPSIGHLSLVRSTGWSKGISQAAARALNEYGLNTDHLRALYMREMSKSQWNRVPYGRNARDTDPGYAVSDGMIIGPAWLPRNADPVEAILSLGVMPPRNINNDGTKAGPGSSYGLIFSPMIDVDAARDHNIIVVTQYEPDALVALLE